ncbi:MAG: trehalose-phosphatase, partial [Thermoleophilaceae bacterium]
QDRVGAFVGECQDDRELKRLRIRVEDKGPIKALHWRGAPDERAAETWLSGVARQAEDQDLDIPWGRKVLEIRPPVPVDKGAGIRSLVEGRSVRSALYGGDDVTDLDAFDALDSLLGSGELEFAVRIGVRSDEGPRAIVERADLVVDGVPGFTAVLSALAE